MQLQVILTIACLHSLAWGSDDSTKYAPRRNLFSFDILGHKDPLPSDQEKPAEPNGTDLKVTLTENGQDKKRCSIVISESGQVKGFKCHVENTQTKDISSGNTDDAGVKTDGDLNADKLGGHFIRKREAPSEPDSNSQGSVDNSAEEIQQTGSGAAEGQNVAERSGGSEGLLAQTQQDVGLANEMQDLGERALPGGPPPVLMDYRYGNGLPGVSDPNLYQNQNTDNNIMSITY